MLHLRSSSVSAAASRAFSTTAAARRILQQAPARAIAAAALSRSSPARGARPLSLPLLPSAPRCCLRFFSSPAAASSSKDARPSHKPDPVAHTAATAAGASAEKPSPLAPSTTADEQADAEAGLNRTVQSGEAKRAAAAAGATATATATATPASVSSASPSPSTSAAPSSSASGGGGGGSDSSSSESSEGKSPLGPANWASVLFLIVVGGGAVVWYRYQQDSLQNSVRLDSIGKPLLGGGPFELTDDTGRRVTSEQLKGRYILLYFGFTYCPDICPTELKKMQEALDLYEKLVPQAAGTSHAVSAAAPKDRKSSVQVTPVFISIDPRRDTPSRLAAYKGAYDPRMLWLTGSDDEIARLAKNYRVYYSAPEVEPGSDDDYLVDHSIFYYLLDRDGQFMEFFGKSRSAEEVATRIAQLVAAENPNAAGKKK